MKAFYSDHFVLPLPPEHRFPMAKYRRLRERVVAERVVAPEDLLVPEPVSREDLLQVHHADYVDRVFAGRLGRDEVRRLGFPWSPAMVERSRRSVGGTLAACRTAMVERSAVNLAGGTHHAFADHGEGYCVFNDVAVALRTLQAEGRLRRAVVLDCDVHQGNGTAALFAGDPTVFTFSVHGRKNFPFRKQRSDLDVELEDGTGDEEYLARLLHALRELALAEATLSEPFELAVYVAGADPFEGDRLGRLSLSKAGLARRDALIFEFCRTEGLPVAVVMAGGYGEVEDVVDVHLETVRQAAAYSTAAPRRRA